MKNYEIDHLIRELKTNTAPVVLFGAKQNGALAYYALNKLGIKVNYFCDDKEEVRKKQKFCNVPIISSKELYNLDQNTNIFICSYLVEQIISQLKETNFKNIHNCINLFKNTDFSTIDTGMSLLKLEGE